MDGYFTSSGNLKDTLIIKNPLSNWSDVQSFSTLWSIEMKIIKFIKGYIFSPIENKITTGISGSFLWGSVGGTSGVSHGESHGESTGVKVNPRVKPRVKHSVSNGGVGIGIGRQGGTIGVKVGWRFVCNIASNNIKVKVKDIIIGPVGSDIKGTDKWRKSKKWG